MTHIYMVEVPTGADSYTDTGLFAPGLAGVKSISLAPGTRLTISLAEPDAPIMAEFSNPAANTAHLCFEFILDDIGIDFHTTYDLVSSYLF